MRPPTQHSAASTACSSCLKPGLRPGWSAADNHICRPSPRSAHQAVFHKGFIYIWGGELTSPNQVPPPLSWKGLDRVCHSLAPMTADLGLQPVQRERAVQLHLRNIRVCPRARHCTQRGAV